jgi:hypothetical protein
MSKPRLGESIAYKFIEGICRQIFIQLPVQKRITKACLRINDEIDDAKMHVL